jgi:hypothetical protein
MIKLKNKSRAKQKSITLKLILHNASDLFLDLIKKENKINKIIKIFATAI